MHNAVGAIADSRERYSVILDIAGILTGTLKPEELYQSIYEQTSRVLEATGFYIALYDADTDTATVVFYADRGRIERSNVTYRGSESPTIQQKCAVREDIPPQEDTLVLLGEAEEDITRSSITAPMLRDDCVLGVIGVQSYNENAYDDDDLQLLEAVAELAGVALDNARYVAQSERRRREAERLEEIGRAISSSLELQEVLRRVTAAVLDLVDAQTSTVWLLRGTAQDMIETAMTAGDSDLPLGETFPLVEGVRNPLVEQRKGLVLDHVPEHPFLAPELRERLGVETLVAVPLIAEDNVIGALSAGHRESRHYRDDEIRLLERLGQQAAVAVENARLHQKIRMLSLTDPLTGLPNRRQLEVVLEKEFAAAGRGRQLVIVMFDLDYFKRFNDERGHQAGDEALRRFADILNAQTRSMNLAARYGGDEFMTIVSDTDYEGALTHISRVNAALAKDALLNDIGVSAGIAEYSPDMVGPEDLIRAADADLYRRKKERGL